MKKLLAICLTFIMVISLAAVPSMAATVEIPGETVFDQWFLELTSPTSSVPLTKAPDGWTIVGEEGVDFCFEAGGIQPVVSGSEGEEEEDEENKKYVHIYYNEPFNAGKADYTFIAKIAHNIGKQYLHFGANTIEEAIARDTDVSGYTLVMDLEDYTTGKYTLYKDGELVDVTLTDGSTRPGDSRDYTFTVTSTGMTISGNPFASAVTVPDNDPIKNGYIGISLTNNNWDTTTYNSCKLGKMTLTTTDYSYEIEDVEQENTGAYASTEQKLVSETTGASYFDQDYRTLNAVPSDTKISYGAVNQWDAAYGMCGTGTTGYIFGDFSNVTPANDVVVDARYTARGDRGKITLIFFGYWLQNDCTAGTMTLSIGGKTTLGSVSVPKTTGSNGLTDVKVELINGKINVTITPVDSGVPYTITADETTITRTGSVELHYDTNNNGGTVAYMKVHTPDYSKTEGYKDVEIPNFILDRTFAAGDTVASLLDDGFVVYADANEYGIPQATISGALQAQVDTIAKFGGDYTVEVNAGKKDNWTSIILNGNEDFTRYYAVDMNQGNSPTVQIRKHVDGTNTTLKSFTDAISINEQWQDYTASVDVLDDGSVKISVTIKEAEGDDQTFEAIDASDVFTSGKIRINQFINAPNSNTYNYIKSLKVYPTSKANSLVYEGVFSGDGVSNEGAAKGNVWFTFPVIMLGQSPEFIAALYEDGKMTDIKFFDVETANASPTILFDTTSSDAEKVEIKVFIWDTLEGMTPVSSLFTLD